MQGSTEILWTHTAEALAEYGRALRDRYKESLRVNNRPTQRNTLAGTAEYLVDVGEVSFEVSLRLQDYWKYVEEGTRPHWPPPSVIREWVEVKPVLPRPLADGKLPTVRQLAFLIGRKIAKKGTAGTHDLEQSIEAIEESYLQRIDAAIERDVRDHVDVLLASWDTYHPQRIL